MAIIRQKREKNYSVVNNQILEDTRMSFKARGLLTYMLSKPDNWQFYADELVKHSDKDGISAIKSALNELEACGYLKRVQKRAEKGKFGGQDWILNECPADSPQGGFPLADKPSTGKPLADNQQLLSTDGTKYLKNQVLKSSSSIPAEKSAENLVEVPEPKESKAVNQKSLESKPELKSPWDLWQANWGFPNSIAQQDLVEWTKQFGNELVYHAIEYALKSNVSAKGADRYLERVFDSYEKNKIDSVAKALDQEEQHYQQKTREYSDKKSYGKRSGRPVYQKEQLPDWAQKDYQAPEESTEEQEHKAQLQAEIKRRLAEIKADKDGGQNVANS